MKNVGDKTGGPVLHCLAPYSDKTICSEEILSDVSLDYALNTYAARPPTKQ